MLNIGMNGKNRKIDQIIYNESNLPCLLMESFFGMSGRGAGIFSGFLVKRLFPVETDMSWKGGAQNPIFIRSPFSLGDMGTV